MELDRSGYEVLAPDECLRLLAGSRTGRLGLHIGALPTVVPVGCLVFDDAIVIGARTDDGLRTATDNAVVAFEVDDIDASTGARWSVVVIGVVGELSGPALRGLDGLPAGQRLIRLTIDLVSGRRSQRADAATAPAERQAA